LPATVTVKVSVPSVAASAAKETGIKPRPSAPMVTDPTKLPPATSPEATPEIE
jgi:hypothetical protein